jgi:hypothetical protein
LPDIMIFFGDHPGLLELLEIGVGYGGSGLA